jgi:hypothetical protein
MIKIHGVRDAETPAALASCRVSRVDASNAVCMVHHPGCVWATPFGNYCEHPQVERIGDYNPAEDRGGSTAALH